VASVDLATKQIPIVVEMAPVHPPRIAGDDVLVASFVERGVLSIDEMARGLVPAVGDPIVDTELEEGNRNSGNTGGAGGSGAGVRPPVSFCGVRARAHTICYVVDASGSMDGAPFDDARQRIHYSVAKLDRTQSFCVRFYRAFQVKRFPQGPKAGAFVSATNRSIADLVGWMQKVKPGGLTTPAGALRAALESGPDVVFFYSDGIFSKATLEVAKTCRKPGTVIHALCLGHDDDGERRLQQLASLGGGTCTFVPLHNSTVSRIP